MRARTIRRIRIHPVGLAVLALLGACPAGFALPQGAQVVAGQVTVGAPAGGRLGIVQASSRAIVDWRSFGIGAGEAVTLAQPGGGVALFRVAGGEASTIFGSLSATGTLFLSSPGGVLFGANARADVGSLVATTLGIGNADFLAGRYAFAGDSRASVVNEGTLSAPGGSVVLLGASVANRGTISAPQGAVALGAGSAATLDVYGNGLLRLNLTAGADGARIDHAGTITADGGTASASALGAGAVLNIGGVIRAQSLEQRDCAIVLTGGAGSQLTLGGTLDASAGAGGTNGGRIELGAERIVVDAAARLRADAAGTGHGGTVNAIATDTMGFAGALSARGGAAGGHGGQAEVSGYRALTMSGTSDLSAPAGRTGTLLLDPGSVSIIDSIGNQNGPNQFGDANLATLLASNSVTISTANATGNGAQALTVDGAANVTWSAATTLTLSAGQSVRLAGGAVIQNTNAGAAAFDAIVLNGNTANTPTTSSSSGVVLSPGSVLEATRGNIRINGRGGSTGDFNQGVLIQGAVGTPATVRTANGAIAITGTGGAAASAGTSRGISIETAATIEATGGGSVSLVGNGTAGTTDVGVAFVGGAATLRTTTGALSVNGAGTGTLGGIIFSNSAATLGSTSGAISLTGGAETTAVTGISGGGAAVTLGGAGTSGTLTLASDRIAVSSFTASTTGTMVVQPLTTGRAIGVGAGDSATTLGLSLAELAGFSAGRLEIGNANAGSLTVSQAYAPAAGTGTLALISGGTVGVNAAITGGTTRLSLVGTAGVRLGAALSSNATNVASTRAITIRTPGSFTNTVGASALSTPNGSWAVSLATPVGQGFNGLLSGNPAVWSNPVTSNVNPTGNRYSFALAPTIVIDAGAATKVYGDALPTTVALNNAPVTSIANTFGGVFTDYANATLGGSFTRSSTGLAATANAGSYADLAVTSVAGVTTSLVGYSIVASATGTVTVSPRSVTLTPAAQSRLYGDANPATGAATGLVNGDTARLTLSTPATPTSAVGGYDLSGSGAVFQTGLASNYVIAYGTTANGLTVTQRAITLTPDAQSRVYGNANLARGTAAVTSGSLVGTDALADVALSSPATAGSGVGTYALSAGNAIFASGSDANYAISYTALANGLTVTQRPVTLTLQGSASRPYGGGVTNVNFSAPTVTGGSLAAGDGLFSFSTSFAGPALTAPVGTYGGTFVGASLVNGAGQSVTANYAITRVDAPFFVTQRPVTLTPVAVSRTYGDANPTTAVATSNSGTGVGLVNGDAVSQLSITSPAGAASNVGSYPSTGGNAVFATGSAGNYAISYGTNAAGLVITQRPLTITPDAVSRVYGDPNPATATATGNDLVNGDTIGTVALVSAATAASNVGRYATSGSNAVFATGLASNYDIRYVTTTGGLVITPRPLTITPDAATRAYGDANPASGTARADNLVNGDTVASVTLASPATAASPVGRYDLDASAVLFGTGLASNYTIAYASAPGALAVGPRGLTLTPATVTGVYGDALPADAPAIASGLVNGDSVTTLAIATPASATSNVGSYASTGTAARFGSGSASNYTIAFATNPAGVTVAPRPLTITPVAVARPYGDTNPTSSGATATNLANSDTVASVTLTSSATPASNVGSYGTTASNAQFGSGLASNYTISYAPNSAGLTITPRALTLTPDAVTRAYGDANPASGSAAAANLVNGDTVASVALASPAASTDGVGSYALTASNAQFGSGSAANYTITYAPNPAGLLVAPRAVAVSVTGGQFKFTGQPDPAFTSALTGGTLVGGDTFSGNLVRAPGEVPGPYPIGQGSLGLGPNYSIAFSGAPFTVVAAGRIATIDRTPAPGAPSSAGAGFASLLAALPPTAAGNGAAATECVREAVLDAAQAGSSRIVNRGIRLPEGVVDACR